MILKEIGYFKDSIFLVFEESDVYNSYLKKVFERKYLCIDSRTFKVISLLHGKKFSKNNNIPDHIYHPELDYNNIFNDYEKITIFNKNELDEGQKWLQKYPDDHNGIIIF